MKAQIVKIRPTVEKHLRENPKLRDDDRLLMAVIWLDLLPSKHVPVRVFLDDFARGKYPHPESIRRVRAKLQKDNPELRGVKYNKRKGVLCAQTRDKMKEVWNDQSEEKVAHSDSQITPVASVDPTKQTGFINKLFNNFFKPEK